MIVDYDFCISSYLTFRYVASKAIAWKPGIMSTLPAVSEHEFYGVRTASEILDRLRGIVNEIVSTHDVGILLSSGIDSAIIAALLPPTAKAYTVRFVAAWDTDESLGAAQTAQELGLEHRVVSVTWDDYTQHMDHLMMKKRSPLHPAEVGLYMAASAAFREGVNVLFVGNGADSTFGGLDKLLAHDWSFDGFIERYSFLDPKSVVRKPKSMRALFEPYRRGEGIDVLGFLKTVHGLGIIQMFENAIQAAGCQMVAPFERLILDGPLDIERIRRGEPKYLIQEVFKMLFADAPVRVKIPFARPMDYWLAEWEGPLREEFLADLDVTRLSGDQKWLIYCLERYLDLIQSRSEG